MGRIVGIVADHVLPETTLPHASFAPLAAALREAFARLDAPGKIALDQTPAGREIGVPGRQGPDAMQVIGQNNDGLDGEWPALTGRLEHLPKVVNVFGQEFPAAFQERDREKERTARNKGANVVAAKIAVALAEGGMRFTFPPYGGLQRAK